MYVGIDIGGREGRNTEIALLQSEGGRLRITAIHEVPPRGDDFIVDFLVERRDVAKGVGIDSPLDLPPCLRCGDVDCPGLENCPSDETRMIVDSGGNPYAERLTETYVSNALDEVRPMQTMALGQIVARTMYLLKRLRCEEFPIARIREVYPRASLFAFRRALKLPRADFDRAMRRYKKNEGQEARAFIVDSLSPIMDFSSFGEECEECHDKLDAAVAGLSAYFSVQNLSLPRPEELPSEAGWIEIPDWTRIVPRFGAVIFKKG